MNANVTEEAAIRLAVMDYAEGWFEGDAVRMERSLHPKLVKRALRKNTEQGGTYIYEITKEDMVQGTRDGGGTSIPRENLLYKIEILDVYEEIALVRAETYPFVDYLQLVKEDGQWLILNALYTRRRG